MTSTEVYVGNLSEKKRDGIVSRQSGRTTMGHVIRHGMSDREVSLSIYGDDQPISLVGRSEMSKRDMYKIYRENLNLQIGIFSYKQGDPCETGRYLQYARRWLHLYGRSKTDVGVIRGTSAHYGKNKSKVHGPKCSESMIYSVLQISRLVIYTVRH